MNEVELKYECDDLEALKQKASTVGFKEVRSSHQTDIYFIVDQQHPDGCIYLRLRDTNGTFSLDFHQAVNLYEAEETQVTVGNKEDIVKIFTQLGYPVVCEVDKHRVKLKREDVILTLDRVEKLGTFAEIEMNGTTDLLPKIREIAKELGLDKETDQKPYSDMIRDL